MALKLIANYSKRLGLPGYSSHQFSVSVETEISNINEVQQESERLYATLQNSVDDQIQHTGFIPEPGYGGQSKPNGENPTNSDGWLCSDKQRELILRLVTENNLDRKEVDETSRQMFGIGVRELNKLQASGLIERLIEDTGGSRPRRKSTSPRRQYANGGTR